MAFGTNYFLRSLKVYRYVDFLYPNVTYFVNLLGWWGSPLVKGASQIGVNAPHFTVVHLRSVRTIFKSVEVQCQD